VLRLGLGRREKHFAAFTLKKKGQTKKTSSKGVIQEKAKKQKGGGPNLRSYRGEMVGGKRCGEGEGPGVEVKLSAQREGTWGKVFITELHQ